MIVYYGNYINNYIVRELPVKYKHNILWAFPRCSPGIIELIKDKPFWQEKIFLDSGAFSAYTIGEEINLQEYIDFLHKMKEYLEVYAALDVIGDPKASWQNYKEMVKQGLNPLPCFHQGSDFKWLHRYADKTDYIGLGKLAILKDKKVKSDFLSKVFNDFPDPKKIGFHGFGMTDLDLVKEFPFKSIDSNAAGIIAFSGNVFTKTGKPYSIGRGTSKTKKYSEETLKQKDIREMIEGLGYSYEIACQEDVRGKFERIIINMKVFEDLVNKNKKDTFKKVSNSFL